MAELDNDVKRLGELLDAERSEVKDADALLAAQDEELQNQSQSLARSKAKGARARNMRETDAVERELEVIRRTMKEREEERETLKAAIDKRRGSVDKHEKELAELERFAGRGEAEGRDAAGRAARRARARHGRPPRARGQDPGDVLRRYELIRDKRAGVGAVAGQGRHLRRLQHVAAPDADDRRAARRDLRAVPALPAPAVLARDRQGRAAASATAARGTARSRLSAPVAQRPRCPAVSATRLRRRRATPGAAPRGRARPGRSGPAARLVSGPRAPLPTVRSSISRTGVISAAVPVKKTSSARVELVARQRALRPFDAELAAQREHGVARDAAEDRAAERRRERPCRA